MSNFPPEWRIVALGEIGGFKNGINKDKEDFGFGVKFINLMDVFGHTQVRDARYGLVNASPDEVENYRLLYGDVLFVRSSVKPEGVGLTAVVVEDLPETVYSGFLIRYRNDGSLDAIYARHCFYEPSFRRDLLSKSTISANTNINQEALKSLRLPLPPLPEQRKIAAILSTWDEAIALTEQLIAALQQRKQALMQLLLTGRVRFAEFEGSEWEEGEIGEVVTTFSGGTPSRTRQEYFGGEIAWIKSGEINQVNIKSTEETITEIGLNNSSAKIVEKDTVLLALYGATAGKVGITRIKAAINQALLALIPKADVLDNGYLFYELQNQMREILRKLQGGQPNLSAQLVNESYISLPPLEEQRKIADVLRVVDEELENFRELVSYLQAQKRGLMQQLLTGAVRVAVEGE